jgi:hypothetical protein
MIEAHSGRHKQKQHLAAVSASAAMLSDSKFCCSIIDVDIDGGVRLFFDLEMNLLSQHFGGPIPLQPKLEQQH